MKNIHVQHILLKRTHNNGLINYFTLAPDYAHAPVSQDRNNTSPLHSSCALAAVPSAQDQWRRLVNCPCRVRLYARSPARPRASRPRSALTTPFPILPTPKPSSATMAMPPGAARNPGTLPGRCRSEPSALHLALKPHELELVPHALLISAARANLRAGRL